MATLRYSRRPGGQFEVVLTFRAGWRDTAVAFHGSPLGVVPSRAELEAGREFALPGGESLSVRLPKRLMPVPEVFIDGERLRAHAQSSQQRLRSAFQTVLLLALVNLVVGGLAVCGVGFVRNMGASGYNLAYGVVLLALAELVRRRWSLALAAATALFAMDSAAWVYFAYQQGRPLPPAALVVRAVFLLFLVRGFTGIRQLRAEGQDIAANAEPSAAADRGRD